MSALFSPRLFISYSRLDKEAVKPIVSELERRGFRVFLDTSDNDPGDNFVRNLLRELDRCTAVIAVVSKNYSRSRWGQAELYHAVAMGKIAIPLLLNRGSLSGLDEPLQRLLSDIQFVDLEEEGIQSPSGVHLAELLNKARKRHLREVGRRALSIFALLLVAAVLVGWAVTHSNALEQERRRDSALREVVQANGVLQRERVADLAGRIAGDRAAIGELLYLSRDPARRDVTRFNALAMAGELLRGHKTRRWYVQGVDANRISLDGVSLTDVSFLGGSWQGARIRDSTFAGVFWTKKRNFSMEGAEFRNVEFFGGEMEGITAIDVSFVNSKFRGMSIDTTNFGKVRFVTEEPKTEGNQIITPDYTLFEHSVLTSQRTPPSPKILDLSLPGDDVLFDGVVFVDCRLEGWFKAEWFRHSSFERCELPASLTREALEQAGNTVG
jgi:uncharacterized protein YjbI with pentapeptide repeats